MIGRNEVRHYRLPLNRTQKDYKRIMLTGSGAVGTVDDVGEVALLDTGE